MFSRLRSDIQCILDRDPAARSTWEVLTCYPGLHALLLHRLAHRVWKRDFRWLGRFISQVSRWLTGIEIWCSCPAALSISPRIACDSGSSFCVTP